MPMPELSGNLIPVTFISFNKKSKTFFTSLEFASHSIPAYMSSVFSLKIIISVVSDCFKGVVVPGKYLMGLMHANKSISCLIATLSDLNPLPTGVVKGPLIETTNFSIAEKVSFGKKLLLP